MVPEAIKKIESYVDHPSLGPTARQALSVFAESGLLSHSWSTTAQSSTYVAWLYRMRAERITDPLPGLYESIKCLGERDVEVYGGIVEMYGRIIATWVSDASPDIAGIMIFSGQPGPLEAEATPLSRR